MSMMNNYFFWRFVQQCNNEQVLTPIRFIVGRGTAGGFGRWIWQVDLAGGYGGRDAPH
jgi:hypothetical protein